MKCPISSLTTNYVLSLQGTCDLYLLLQNHINHILVLHILSLGSFVPLPWLVMNGKVKAPFRTRLSEVHPTNSQSVPLPEMGFEYINSLPPIHYGSFRPKVGIMTHLLILSL